MLRYKNHIASNTLSHFSKFQVLLIVVHRDNSLCKFSQLDAGGHQKQMKFHL